MRRALVALATVLALAAPPGAGAQQPKAELYDIEDEVMCVSCNVPLFIAESPQADRQRAFIRDSIDQGLTKEQIKARLVDEYGKDVLAMPENDGTGLAAKIVPVVAIVLLAGLLALLVPRWRRREPAPAVGGLGAGGGTAATPTDAELQRLDEDLKRLG